MLLILLTIELTATSRFMYKKKKKKILNGNTRVIPDRIYTSAFSRSRTHTFITRERIVLYPFYFRVNRAGEGGIIQPTAP